MTLGVWVDGKLVHSARSETVVQTLASVDAYRSERVRVDLSEGDHSARAGIHPRRFRGKTLPEASLESKKLNKWIGPRSVVVGPFASKQVEAEPQAPAHV